MSQLKKLQKTAELIESMTDGAQQFKDDGVGHPFLCSRENTHLGMEMIVKGNPQTQKYDITFGAYARDMGKHLGVEGVLAISKEAMRIYALLTALELEPCSLTEEEFRQFSDWVAAREAQEQSETQAISDGPSLGM